MKKLILLLGFLAVTTLCSAAVINIPTDYSTIQAGIDAASDYDTVLVDTGTYVENINFNGKNITVASLFLTTQDTSYISQTVIDGDSSGSVVTFDSGEDSTALLSGFTITNGSDESGGGIFCCCSSPSLEHLILLDNNSYGSFGVNGGGGFGCWNSNPSLENVIISGNSANCSGGGIYCEYYASPSLKNVIITDNSARDGGGISCGNSSPSLENVTISNNTADYGGGIHLYDSSLNLINTIVTDNSGNYGIYVVSGSPSIEFCDFYNNQNGNFYGGDPYLGVNVMTNANGDSCDAWYNIQEDPLFVEPDSSNYHLTANSPCIDAGDPSSPLDPDGTIADMGAYYYNQNQAVGNEHPELNANFISIFPNPLSPSDNKFNLKFSLPKPGKAKIQIFNIKGQLVSTVLEQSLNSGEHNITHSLKEVSNGIYFIKLEVDDEKSYVRKLLKLD